MKKLISLLLCLVMVLSLSITAFAAESSVQKSTAYDITLRNHTDVIMRASASTSAAKVHTLYVGETVTVHTWQVSDIPTNGHYWAYISHEHLYDNGTPKRFYGYSANDLLS